MSQERPFGNSGAEHHPEPDHPRPIEEAAVAVPTPNRFWRMMTDPGFPSPASNPASFMVTTEAFLGLTSQVQALAGMVQTIVPYLPQLVHSTAHQSAPPQTESPAAPNRGVPPEAEPPQPQVAEARAASPTLTPARSQSRSYNPVPTEPNFDTLSTDTANSLREQVRRVHQRLDEVQKEVLKSRGEVGESSKEFELNFLASARPRPTTASLLGMAQGSDEPLSQFVGRFTSQVQGIPDLHPSLVIQAFLTGLRPSRFFWSLIERPPVTLPEMLQRAHQYIAAETLIAGNSPVDIRRHLRRGGKTEGITAFTGNTDTTPRNVVTCSTKLKTLSDAAIYGDMSANYHLSLTAGLPETRLPDLRARSEAEEHSPHDDALVISLRMANAYVKRVMIDTGSSADILYFDAFQRLGLTDRDLAPLTSTLT
ncbi:hypothetical protein BHM03_00046269 [Ensete ventricosum]|nr:hypothetical protein BHM03_00046269 [Ensete ventricosum]